MLARCISNLSVLCIVWIGSACSLIGVRQNDRSCFPIENLSTQDQLMAEKWLERALDYEGLYTLFGPVKPVSNVIISWFPLDAGTDSLIAIRSRMQQMQRITRALHCGPVESVWVPFNQTFEKNRYVQLSFVHRDAFRDVMRADSLYWIQWGFTDETNPGIVLATLEFEQNSIRHRGLGYLYGYPKYAVDFFVDSRIREDSTHLMVSRDFFQIPVHRAETGHFTYAIPRGHLPGAVDSVRYNQSMEILGKYRKLRPDFVRPDSSLRSLDLIRMWLRSEELQRNVPFRSQ